MVRNTLTALTFWGGILYFIHKDVRHFRRPSARDIDKRLETSSNLPTRPIEAIQDRLANPGHEATETLWAQYKEQSLSLIARLRPPLPHGFIAGLDHYALRVAVFLLFIIAVVAAPPDWSFQIKKGMFPYIKAETKVPLTLWITPPEYTGMDIITVQSDRPKPEHPVTIPQGSTIKVRMDTKFITPALQMDEIRIPLQKSGAYSWQLETAVTQTDTIKIKQGFITRYTLPVRYKKDEPPNLRFVEEKGPVVMPKGSIQFPLIAHDDFGIRSLNMHMTLDPIVTDKPLGGDVTETRPFTSLPDTDTELLPYFDLAWHPWAGLPVVIELSVTDDLGQSYTMAPIKMTLPERTFEHPLAKLLIEMRHRLSWAPGTAASDVRNGLEQVIPYPDKYQNDIVVMLSMRSMASRLKYAPTGENVIGIISQLWDTALRVEDGNLSLAARNLRDAQQNLQSLLNDPNATNRQIAKAMENLKQAMNDYFQELARELQKRAANGKPLPMLPQDMANSLNADEIASFLEQLQSESLAGNRDKAMEMLSRLEKMMNALDPAMNAQMPPHMQFMQKGINELQELIDKQKTLLNQTERQAATIQRATPQDYGQIIPPDEQAADSLFDEFDLPQPQDNFELPDITRPEINTQGHKVEQDSLRYILGQLMQEADAKLNEIPENMQNAEMEMRKSGDALGGNDPDRSIPHQKAAIKYLQEAQQQMTQQLMAMMQQMQMLGFGPGQTDPFGRPIRDGNGPSWLSRDKVKVPDKAQRKRAQEILKELRDRSGDRSRPDYELDYYNRLMKQF